MFIFMYIHYTEYIYTQIYAHLHPDTEVSNNRNLFTFAFCVSIFSSPSIFQSVLGFLLLTLFHRRRIWFWVLSAQLKWAMKEQKRQERLDSYRSIYYKTNGETRNSLALGWCLFHFIYEIEWLMEFQTWNHSLGVLFLLLQPAC